MKYRQIGPGPRFRVGLVLHLFSTSILSRYQWFVDPMLTYLQGTVADVGVFRASDLLNTYSGKEYDSGSVDIDAYPPIGGYFSPLGDSMAYGGLQNNFLLFTGVLGVTPPVRRSLSRAEHPVRHHSSRGSVVSAYAEGTSWYLGETGDVVDLSVPNFVPIEFGVNPQAWHPYDAKNLRMVSQNDFRVVEPDGFVFPRPRLKDRLDKLRTMAPFGYASFYNGVYQDCRIDTVDYTLTKSSLILNWTGRSQYASESLVSAMSDPFCKYVFNNTLDIGFVYELLDLSAILLDGDESPITNVVSCHGTYTTRFSQPGSRYFDTNPDFTGSTSFDIPTDSQCVILSREMIRNDPVATVEHVVANSPLVGFAAQVYSSLDVIRPIAFRSFTDAGENLVDSIKSNLVESVGDLFSLQHLVPDLKEIKTVFSGDLSLRGLQDSLKAGSGEYLKTIFGISPFIGLLKDLPKIYSILGRLNALREGTFVLRGRHDHTMPNGLGRSNAVRITSHSKVVLNTAPNEYVSKLLSLASLEIFPLPSNLWDLVPLSFVIDWFLNISDHLESIESLVLMTMLDIRYLVHSFTVQSDVTSDEYALMDVLPDVSESLTLRVYVREISLLVPGPTNRGIDFFLPSKLSNWITPIALISVRS